MLSNVLEAPIQLETYLFYLRDTIRFSANSFLLSLLFYLFICNVKG